MADVAGVKPAFFIDDFARSVLTFVIALHHAGAFGENFTVFRNANQNVGNGTPGAAGAILRIVGREDGRSLGEAVPLVNGDPYRPEKFGKLLGKRRAAGKNHAQFSACARANLLVDKFV